MKLGYLVILSVLLLLFGCLSSGRHQGLNSVDDTHHLNITRLLLTSDNGVYEINVITSNFSANIKKIDSLYDLSYITFIKNNVAYGVYGGELREINLSSMKIIKKFEVEPSNAKVYIYGNKILLLDDDLNLYIYNNNGLVKKIKVGDSLPECSPNLYCINSFIVKGDVLYSINQKQESHIDEGYVNDYYVTIVDLRNYNVKQIYKRVNNIMDYDYLTTSISDINNELYLSGVNSNGPLIVSDYNGNIIKTKELDEPAFKIQKVGDNILLEGIYNCHILHGLNEVTKFKCNFLSTESDGTYIYSVYPKNEELFLNIYNMTSLVKSVDLNLTTYEIGGYQLLLVK